MSKRGHPRVEVPSHGPPVAVTARLGAVGAQLCGPIRWRQDGGALGRRVHCLWRYHVAKDASFEDGFGDQVDGSIFELPKSVQPASVRSLNFYSVRH